MTNCSPADHYHHFGLWYAWTKTNVRRKRDRFLESPQKTRNSSLPQLRTRIRQRFCCDTGPCGLPRFSRRKSSNERTPGDQHRDNILTRLLHRHIIPLSASPAPARSPWKLTVMAAYASVRAKTGTIRQPKCSPRKAFPATKLTVREPVGAACQGKAGNEKACILIVASPSNLNYPEPLRVWDKTVNKPAGDVMWNFSPTKQEGIHIGTR